MKKHFFFFFDIRNFVFVFDWGQFTQVLCGWAWFGLKFCVIYYFNGNTFLSINFSFILILVHIFLFYNF